MKDYNDDLLGLRLRDQIHYEIRHQLKQNLSFWVAVCRNTGQVLSKPDDNIVSMLAGLPLCRPPVEFQLWARFACERVNKLARKDGAWVVVWCDPTIHGVPTRVMFLFKDKDGDVPCMFDCAEPFPAIVMLGTDWFVHRAEQVVDNYRREWIKDLGIKPEQQIRAALGQASVDPKANLNVL